MSNVKEIVTQWLKAYGFDGLYSDTGECGCSVDDLMPCDSPCDTCAPAVRTYRPCCGEDIYASAKPVVRCKDCAYGEAVREVGCILLDSRGGDLKDPDGFCAWGKPRENPCQNADENAAAFADAPTLKTAREPLQTPVLELGA